MATLDVTGRTLKESKGKSRAAKVPPGRLVPTDQGLAPDDTHRGVSPLRISRNRMSTPSTDLAHISNGVNSLAPEDAPRGRKHIDTNHQVLSEDGKRQLGRIGVKKVVPPHQSPLRPAASDNRAAPPGVERMRLCTAEQQARRRLEKVVTTHKELEPFISDGMRRGGDVLVNLEKRVQKHLLLEASKEHQRARTPENIRPRTADLGRTNLSVVPFAVESTTAIGASPTKVTAKRTYQGTTARSVNESNFPSRFSKKLDPTRVSCEKAPPYDTATQSATYPEPPIVGVSGHAHHGKGHVEFNPERKNIDEELQRKAEARCHFSANQRGTFLTTQQQRPSTATDSSNRSPSRNAALRAVQESRCKAAEERHFTSRRGKMVSEEKYRSTALW